MDDNQVTLWLGKLCNRIKQRGKRLLVFVWENCKCRAQLKVIKWRFIGEMRAGEGEGWWRFAGGSHGGLSRERGWMSGQATGEWGGVGWGGWRGRGLSEAGDSWRDCSFIGTVEFLYDVLRPWPYYVMCLEMTYVAIWQNNTDKNVLNYREVRSEACVHT